MAMTLRERAARAVREIRFCRQDQQVKRAAGEDIAGAVLGEMDWTEELLDLWEERKNGRG